MIFLTLLLMQASGGVDPLDVSGIWATENGRAHVEIVTKESSGPRGEIIWFASYDEAEADGTVLGQTLLRDFEKKEDRWGEGTIYNLKNGKAYRSSIRRHDVDTLEVEGCLLLFCRSQYWSRVPDTEIRRIAEAE